MQEVEDRPQAEQTAEIVTDTAPVETPARKANKGRIAGYIGAATVSVAAVLGVYKSNGEHHAEKPAASPLDEETRRLSEEQNLRNLNRNLAESSWKESENAKFPDEVLEHLKEMDRLLQEAKLTRAAIGVTDEMVSARYGKTAEKLWGYAKESLSCEELGEKLRKIDDALAMAHIKREDIGATPDAIRESYIAIAQKAWSQAVYWDGLRMPGNQFREMDEMKQALAEAGEDVGVLLASEHSEKEEHVTDGMVRELEARMEQEMRKE